MNQIKCQPAKTTMVVLCLAAALLAIGPPSLAQPAAEKNQYHLFNPTPDELLRELSPDRPDGTESPTTVDAGHFQIELSFIDYARDEDDDVETLSLFDTNLKVGLTNNTDLQLIFQAYAQERTDTPTGTMEVEGFSDVTLRLKVNLWGNDPAPGSPQLFGLDTAVGVMPFVKIPTGTDLSNDHAEGGFIIMLGLDVSDKFGLGFMLESGVVYDEDDDDYDGEFVHTAVLGFDVSGPLGAYVEYIGVVSTDTDSDYQAYFSGGFTYAIKRDLLLDIGARFGMTTAAEDAVVFMGLTWRY